MVLEVRRPVSRCHTCARRLVNLICFVLFFPSTSAKPSGSVLSGPSSLRGNSFPLPYHYQCESFVPAGVRSSRQAVFPTDLESTTGLSAPSLQPAFCPSIASTQTRLSDPPSRSLRSKSVICREARAYLRPWKERISQGSSSLAGASGTGIHTSSVSQRRQKDYETSSVRSVLTPGNGIASAPLARRQPTRVWPSSVTKANAVESRLSFLPAFCPRIWEIQGLHFPLQSSLPVFSGGSPILGSPFSRFGHDGRQTGFEGVSAAWKPSPRRDWPGEEPGNRTKSPERRCLGARPVGSVTRGSPREFRRHLMQWKRASPLASTPFHKAPAGMRAVTEEESKRRTVVRSLDHPESDWEWGPAHRLATRGEDVAEREGRTTAKHPSCISRRKDRRREEPGRELREERTEGLRLSPQTACLAEQRDPRQGGKPFVPAKVEAARGRTFPVEEETPFLEPEEAIRRKWSDLRRQHHERHKGGGRTLVLGIETSCDDTCVGIVEGESGRILANVCTPQPELLIKYGGVHPSEAAAAHDRRMRSVVRNALQEAGVSLLDIDIIAFTRGPGIVPCLSVGASAALEIAGELTEAWADAEAKLFANPSSVSSLSDDASSLARAPSVVAENGGSLRDSVRKQARSGYRVVDSVAAEDPKQRTSTETERREAHEALEGTQVTGERPENAGDLDPEAGRELSWLSKEERDAMLRRLASDNAPEWQADEKLSRGRPPLVVAVNHLHGHLLSAGRDTQAKDASGREDPICSPACYLPPTFLALLVSGGHTFSCVVKACEENHLHLRPKLFLVPTRGRRNRSGGHPRGGDISGEASEKGHDTETKEKNGKGEEGVERAEEIKVHSDTGVERIQGQSRESLRGPSHRVETPGKGGPERKDSGYAPGMRRGETNGHDAEEREAATRRRDPEGSDEPGNVSRDALVEVWGTWEDPEAANPDGCVSGLQCIYTGQTEDDAVGEAIDKSMRCLKTAASSSPPAPRSSSAAGFRSSAAPSLGFPTVLLTASPSSPSPSLCPRASPLRPAHSSDTDASRESSPGARGATAESRGICDDNEGAPGSRGSTSREAARTGRGAGLEGRHGGALMEEMAAAGNASVPLPNMLCLKPKTLNFSFSGLKSAFATAVSKAAQLKDDEQGQCDFAASLQAAVFKHLEDQLRKTMWLYEFLDNFPRSLAVVGGVSCNETLRGRLRRLCESRGETAVQEQEFKRLKNRLKVLARRIPDSFLSQVLAGQHAARGPSTCGRHETSTKSEVANNADATLFETSKRCGRSSSFLESSDREPSGSCRQDRPATSNRRTERQEEIAYLHGVTHGGWVEPSAFEQDETEKLREQDRRRKGTPFPSPQVEETKQRGAVMDPRGILDRKLRAFSFAHYCRLRVGLRDLVSALKGHSPGWQEQEPIFFLSSERTCTTDASCSLGETRRPMKGLDGGKTQVARSTDAKTVNDGQAARLTPKLTAPSGGSSSRSDYGDRRQAGSRVREWKTFWTSKPLCNDNGVMIAWAAVNALRCMDLSTRLSPEALRDAPPSEAPVSRPAGKQLARRSHICKGRMQTEAATDREACRVGSEKNPPDRGHREDRDEGGGAQALEANTQQQQLQKLRDGAEGNFVCSPDGSGEEIRNLKVIVAKSNDKKLVTPKWLGGISLCADDLLSKVEFLILDWIVKSKVLP